MAKKVKPDRETDDVVNILQRFGKYQIVQYFYICLPTVFIASGNVNYVFVAGDIDYRCRVAECEAFDKSFSPSWWPDSKEPLHSKSNRCGMPVLNVTYLQENQCDNNSFTSATSECKEWVYGSNKTIVAWLDLACSPWKTNLVGTVHSIGAVFGMMLGGWAADRFGRKPTYIVTSVIIVIGNLKTFIWSYYGYLTVELAESIISGSAFAAGMVLIIEISGNKQRILSGVLFAYAIYLGEAFVAGIAIIVPTWQWIIYIICTPPILFLFYIRLLEESPRWLVFHNKFDHGRRLLKLISKSNKINLNLKDLDELDEVKLRQICNVEIESKQEGYKEALRSKEILKRLLITTVARFSATFIYYGLVANSVWLPGNKYMNYALTALMSFPGDILALYFMNKWGRRWPLSYGYIICGVACVSSAYVPESYLWLKIILFMIGKLTVAACFTGIWTFTMELFPTSIRGSMFGLNTLTASAGCMLAPLTPAMDTISPVFSSLFFACSAVASSVLILLAPETKDQPLPASIQDIKNSVVAVNEIKNNAGVDNLGYVERIVNNVRL
ncbi:organic cation transporter protein-like [Nymphalis io]|uniref:organic cation transporter protein-like n=1 Tax=Inachis io TaxID=171585 RepID=UPI002166CEBB|nr:organic cation transporter protein-like [Nymphalis io]